jgi:Uma2 family endonuclease
MKTATAPVPILTAGETEERLYTYDELVREFSETTQPHELWDGKLIMSPTPSFYHQKIAFRLQRALTDWVEAHDLGEVVGAPIDMVLSPHRCLQPDIAFISKERLAIIERVIMGPADLVVEVLSLQGRNRDRIEKRDLYELHGVKEYWIVDAEAKTAEVFALEKGQFQLAVRALPGDVAASRLLKGFQIPVTELFKGIP